MLAAGITAWCGAGDLYPFSRSWFQEAYFECSWVEWWWTSHCFWNYLACIWWWRRSHWRWEFGLLELLHEQIVYCLHLGAQEFPASWFSERGTSFQLGSWETLHFELLNESADLKPLLQHRHHPLFCLRNYLLHRYSCLLCMVISLSDFSSEHSPLLLVDFHIFTFLVMLLAENLMDWCFSSIFWTFRCRHGTIEIPLSWWLDWILIQGWHYLMGWSFYNILGLLPKCHLTTAHSYLCR